MAFNKHFKLSSALLLGTLVAEGTLMSEAAHGADAAKKILDAQHAQRMAAAGGVHLAQAQNLTKLKDAMAHPDQALAMPGAAGSVGAAVTAAAGDNTCAVGGAGGGGGAMPIRTEAEIIAAIRALELAAHPGDATHRQAIRTALGLDPANLAGTQAELNHFLTGAEQRLVHLPEHRDRATMYQAYTTHLLNARANLAAGQPLALLAANLVGLAGAAGPLPHTTEDERIAVIRAVEIAAADAGGPNDNGKTMIRGALSLPAAPNGYHDEIMVFLQAARA